MFALLATLGGVLPGQGFAQSQSQFHTQGAASSPIPGVELLRGDQGNQEKFDPDAAKDAERARQLLRSLMAEDMARAAARDAQPTSAGPGNPGTSRANSAPVVGQFGAPAATTPGKATLTSGAGLQSPGTGITEATTTDENARANKDQVATSLAGEAHNDSATSSRYASAAPVDGERTRALIASLVSEIAPYVIAMLVLYLGVVALKVKLKRDARKSERSGKSGRKHRDGRRSGHADRTVTPEVVSPVAGDTTAART